MPTYRHSYVFADGVAESPYGTPVVQKPLITANGNYPSDMGISFQGGSAQLAIGGTLGGGTYQLQQRLLDGQTWVNVPGASLTSAGVAAFAAPEAVRLRLNVSGASSPSAMAYALDLPEGTSFAPVAGSGGGGGGTATPTFGYATTSSSSFSRPADTTAYAVNDVMSNSTTAPNAGGFTLSGVARVTGGSGVITDIIVGSTNDPATPLQGEIWIYDSAVTAGNDNAAFQPALADMPKEVAIIPFTLASVMGGTGAAGSTANVSGLNIGFTAVGSQDLRYLVKVKNAYTPASGETFTVRAKVIQTN